jgi:hypothetical protein
VALTALLKVLKDKENDIKDSGLPPQNISSMLNGAGNNAPKALTDLLDVLNNKDNKNAIKDSGLTPQNISSMLSGAGSKADVALKALLKVLTDENTKKAMIDKGLTTQNIPSILHGARNNAPKALTNFLTNTNINNLKLLDKKYHKLLESAGIKAPERIKNLLIIQEYQSENTPTTVNEILSKIDKSDTALINGLKKFFQKQKLTESSQVSLATYQFDALEILLGNQPDHELDNIDFNELDNNPLPLEPLSPARVSPARFSPVHNYKGGYVNNGTSFLPNYEAEFDDAALLPEEIHDFPIHDFPIHDFPIHDFQIHDFPIEEDDKESDRKMPARKG